MKLSPEQYEQLKQNYLTVQQFVNANREAHQKNIKDLSQIENMNGTGKIGVLLLRSIQYFEEMEKVLAMLNDMGINKVVEK